MFRLPSFLLLACALTAIPAAAAPPARPKKKSKSRPPSAAPARLENRVAPGGENNEMVPRREIPKALEEPEAPAPWLRWMLHPLKRGMWIRLPIMDTDPNRGITIGVMPIWVFKEEDGERIKQIHAPSLTFNKHFGPTPTYRYYYYPQDDAALVMRASIGKYEREVMGHYEDQTFRGTDYDVLLRVQYNVDAGNRFFGIGPDTSHTKEANYKEDYIRLRVGGGMPLSTGSPWRAHIVDHLQAEGIDNGPLPGLAGFDTTFPGAAPEHRQQSNELRVTVDYDTRDHATTTTEGAFFQVFREHSFRGFASSFEYNRTGADGRGFYRWNSPQKMVTAVQVRAEQLYGNPPFWMLSKLGGKYSLRAYGEGRYVDRGAASANVEQRFTLFDTKMGGVTTEFEVAPFVGIGTVADTPGRMSARYARPVFGGAVRAVAKPQVVGSVDFGVGQEGLAVFMDINYSF
jgi:hypothetical protein